VVGNNQPGNPPQVSLRRLLALITVLCILLGVPLLGLLVLALLQPLLIAGTLLTLLMLMQLPLYFVYRRIRLQADSDERQAGP
jgi:hypothetical protein